MASHPVTPVPQATGPVPHGAGAIAAREKSEQKEVAGRHKNDGQMPHKGAR
jgi:hypothetical protein